MPNQLSKSKKRMTIAESAAVLAALETIAKLDNSTVTDLLRRSARKLIAERATDRRLAKKMRAAVERHAPKMPDSFRSPAKVSKFKREQREYDLLLQELNIAQAENIQRRNSLVDRPQGVRLASFG